MKKHAHWLSLGAAIPISLIVAWMMLDNACDGFTDRKDVSECWQGWVSAWSGWVAAAGALLAALWAVQGVKRQMRHQYLQNLCEIFGARLKEQSDLIININEVIAAISVLIKILKERALNNNIEDNKEAIEGVMHFCSERLRSLVEYSPNGAKAIIHSVITLIDATKEKGIDKESVVLFLENTGTSIDSLKKQKNRIENHIKKLEFMHERHFIEYSSISNQS